MGEIRKVAGASGMTHSVSKTRIWDIVLKSTALLAIIFFVEVCPQFATPGHAQISSIWDQLQGYGWSSRHGCRPKKEPLDDLRPDATPWRSDAMVNAVAAAIERYQKIVASGGWPLVPPGHMMRVGDDDPRVPILRKRLRISGDMSANGSYYDAETFDAELEEGVKHFQRRHGIRASGRIEKSVYPVLNATAEERLAQLKLNYDRLRGLMRGIEDRYVLVNIPAFQLEAVDKYEVQLRHRVIVGRTERETPEVHATIKALNFSPIGACPTASRNSISFRV